MSDQAPAAPSVSPSTSTTDRWPTEATDFVVRTIGTVRDKTTGPAITGARVLVFGMFAALVATVALVLGAIALVRLITVYLPGGGVWAAYLIVGGVFLLAGTALWTRTRSRPRR